MAIAVSLDYRVVWGGLEHACVHQPHWSLDLQAVLVCVRREFIPLNKLLCLFD